jgi:hypothetical protein
MIWYREIQFFPKGRFPQRAEVLLALESDAACTSLKSHSERKSAVLVVVLFYQAHV